MPNILTEFQIHVQNLSIYFKTIERNLILETNYGQINVKEVKFDQNIRAQEQLKIRELFESAKIELKHMLQNKSNVKVVKSVQRDLENHLSKIQLQMKTKRQMHPFTKIQTIDGFFFPDAPPDVEKAISVYQFTKHSISQFNSIVDQYLISEDFKYVSSKYEINDFRKRLIDALGEIAEPSEFGKIEKLSKSFSVPLITPNYKLLYDYVYGISIAQINQLSLDKIKLNSNEHKSVKRIKELLFDDILYPLYGFRDDFITKLFSPREFDFEGNSYHRKFGSSVRSLRSKK